MRPARRRSAAASSILTATIEKPGLCTRRGVEKGWGRTENALFGSTLFRLQPPNPDCCPNMYRDFSNCPLCSCLTHQTLTNLSAKNITQNRVKGEQNKIL